jgi:hypothetical protein
MLVPQRQAPEVHRSDVFPHEVQAAPAVPHWLTAVAVMQVLPLQQPEGHEVGSQTQLPEAHRWPDAQGMFAPQRHAPDVHRSAAALHATQAAPEAPH